jgi:type VI secretion system protein ImpF
MAAPGRPVNRRARNVADQPLPQDRLQPALLDRLTDDEPEKHLELREQRLLTKSRMRRAVLRDLAWLFNTTRWVPGVDPARAPYAWRSVTCFGLPPFSGKVASSLDIVELERAVRQAILDFEPRILPATLRVRALAVEHADHHNVIGVEIHGELWAQPVPLELLIRTEIDLETRQVQIADLAAGSRVA